MKKVPCEEHSRNGSLAFQITDSSLIGRSFYLQASMGGEDWENVPWGAPDQDEDEDEEQEEKDFCEYVIEGVPMTVFISDAVYNHYRLVFKDEE